MERRGCIPRTSAPGAGENQERTILQMAEQNGGGVHKAKLEPVLPVSPRSWTRHGKLQEPMELSRLVGPRRKVETPPAPFERSSEPRTSRAPEGRYPKATCGNDQCYPSRACRTRGYPSRVLFVAQLPTEESRLGPKRPKRNPHPVLSFSEEDKVRTTQPHDDALLITF